MPRFRHTLIGALLLAVTLPAPGALATHPEYPGPVHIGDSGEAVTLVQQAVGAGVDGDFGPGTQSAVREWQRQEGLLDVGWVGPVTWAALFGQDQAPTNVLFEGSGWGHGIGLSQYGALGMAKDGVGYRQVLSHFYTDASVGLIGDVVAGTTRSWIAGEEQPVWVNILDQVDSVTLQAASSDLVFCQNEPSVMATLDENSSPSGYVRILEQRLFDLGYDPGTIDERFDAATTAAVTQYQTDRGLGVDGRVGPQTRSSLWPADAAGENCFIELPVTSATAVTLTADALGCSLTGSELLGSCVGSIRGADTSGMDRIGHVRVLDLIDSQAATPYRAYGDGYLRIRPATPDTFHVVHQTDLDSYVEGVAEVPSSWPAAALQAQAVAARSYGAATMGNVGPASSFSVSRRLACWCQLYSSVLSQVYVGLTRSTAFPSWASAVTGTAGEVLEHPGSGLVQAFYSSSTGGRTQNSEDRFTSALPYLRSVDDSWSLDARSNPWAVWERSRSVQSVAASFDLDELSAVFVGSRYESGSVKTLVVSGVRDGAIVTEDIPIATAVAKLSLPGRYFNVSWPNPHAGTGTFLRFFDIWGSTHAANIEKIAELGITKGCNPPDNDQFCPTEAVTRGQMAAFLVRALDLPPTDQDYFGDDDGTTFENDINRLAAAGITKGCGEAAYCPGATLTRQQMAAFLVRALDIPDATTTNRFVDDDDSQFESVIDALAETGITKGCNPPANDRFCPRDTVTRAQMASFLVRGLAYLGSAS